MRIGRYPQGYLELLDAKSNGVTPADASDFVQPVLDLTEYYANRARAIASASTSTVSATGFWGGVTSAAIVPEGELWRVHNVTVFSTALAAVTAYRIRGCVSLPLLSGQLIMADTVASYAATERPGFGWEFPYPALFGPGWSFGLWAELVTVGTAQAFSVAVHYDRLR
jgi:hypothetical protein